MMDEIIQFIIQFIDGFDFIGSLILAGFAVFFLVIGYFIGVGHEFFTGMAYKYLKEAVEHRNEAYFTLRRLEEVKKDVGREVRARMSKKEADELINELFEDLK